MKSIAVRKKGRPSKFDIKKYQDLYEEYISSCALRYLKLITTETIYSNGRYKASYKYIPDFTLPSIHGYANFCGLNRDTIYSWSKKYPDFSDIVRAIKYEQETMLINGGLSNIFSTKIVVFLMYRLGIVKKV